ncbi:MAG: Hpt domain-containing protein [Verrucomicrobia bacterium]|nr:Hpt domain-containing protein [Verrucomicrobiota bacterium]
MVNMQSNGDTARFQQAVENLSRDIGRDELSEILDTYLTDTRSRMELLSQLLDAGDLPSLARCAHSIQGGSAIFGLHDLKQAALEVELAVRRAETHGLTALIGGVQARFRVLEPMLRDVLSEILPEAPERGGLEE